MDSELKRFEEELERLSPQQIPDGLIARMESAMEGWADESEGSDKVVPFPSVSDVEPVARGRERRSSLWSAAAAVAILGALAGVFFAGSPPNQEETAEAKLPPIEHVSEVVFNPQSARRQLLSTSDEGVVFSNGAPVRVMRLNYVDKVEFRNEDGEEVHMEQPAVNYVLIPVATD